MPSLNGQQFGELRDIVARVFKIDDLVQLMRVELNVPLGEIVAVQRPMLNVAFDLIEWLEPRERTLDFIRALRKNRADVPDVVRFCDPFLGAAPVGGGAGGPSAPGAPGDANAVALVIEFRAVFEQRRLQFGYLNAYKALHDVLHKLQDQQVAIAQAVQRFRAAPTDPLELTRIAAQLEDELVTMAKDSLPNTEFPDEQGEWVKSFENAVRELTAALDPPDLERLGRAVTVLAVLHNQQPALNQELVRCAKRLRTADLVTRMERILAALGAKAAGLRARLTRFADLCQRLTALTIDHDACQIVEPLLATVTAPAVTRDQIADWPETLAAVLRIAARRPKDTMAARLARYATGFDAATDAKAATGQFTLMREQFGRLFNKTDEDLLSVTDNLVREAELLGIELRGFN
jgi:hypothetical protein